MTVVKKVSSPDLEHLFFVKKEDGNIYEPTPGTLFFVSLFSVRVFK